MQTKIRLPWKAIILILAAVLLLAALLAQPGYYLYRELEYKYGHPTKSEQLVYAYAETTGIPYGAYPRELIALLDTSPEARCFVLDYPERQETAVDLSAYDRETVPLFLQWDKMWGYEDYGSSYLAVTGCGPTCLAMAGYYLTGDENMTPDKIAGFAQRNGYYEAGYGSSWTLISEGAEKLGLKATELPLVKKKMVNALEAGNPVILAMGPGDFTTAGHYIVLTGVEDGKFRVNDPNSRENSQRLWSYEEIEGQIRNIWAISAA
jgi:hypothetical protein